MMNRIVSPESGKVKEWKRLNDVSMVPDRGFTRQLKTLDPEYEVVWDCCSCKWEIWKVPKKSVKEPYHVLTVQTDKKSYKELSQDVLLKLTQYSWDKFTAKELAAYFDVMDDQIQRRREKDFKNKIEAMAKETFSYALGIKQVQVPKKFKLERVMKNG
jgi:hypothetical protein